MCKNGTLYLIPVTLGDTPINQVIPDFNREIINTIDVYIVENIKIARRFLKKSAIKKPIDELIFFEINKHANQFDFPNFLNPLFEGRNIGILSDAGCPGVADPGADIVALAHQKNINVIPLIGPSSILLALMASGFNGQSFCFNGYLPKELKERKKKLKELEKRAIKLQQTQLFIETPYRNNNMLSTILENCFPTTLLCVAVDITLKSERISTKTIAEWKKIKLNLHKRPCLFLIGS